MINSYSQNLIVQHDDFDVPYRGIDLAFRRTYNSYSGHDYASDDGSTEIGQYGNGWTNTFDVHMSTNNCPSNGYSWAGFYGFSVYDLDGARYDYCFNSAGQLVPPPGMQGTQLIANPDGGSFKWYKKDGTCYVFYSPYYGGTSAAYSGRPYAIFGRNQHNYLLFNYSWTTDASSSANLSQIVVETEDGSMRVALNFASVAGQDLLSQVIRPDGAVLTYQYDGSGNLSEVTVPAPNNSGQPALIGYGGYKSFMYVAGPRWWVSPAGSDGGYVAFQFASTGSSQVSGIQWVGVMNPEPNDGTATYLQPGISTGAFQYNFESVTAAVNNTSYSDSDGHQIVQYVDGSGRPTTRFEWSGTQWLQTSEAWNAQNDLTATVDARSYETDYTYDANGNTVAEALPSVATSMGTLRPLSLYSYDPYNNVTAFCDANNNATNGRVAGSVTPSDAMCPAGSATDTYTYTYSDPAEPYGYLSSHADAYGYQTTIGYATSSQAGVDAGLPTSVTGAAISQADGSVRTPTQTFAYDVYGNLTSYNKGNGAWSLTYDGLNRLTSATDPDGVTTRTCYYPDDSKRAVQTAAQFALDGGVVCGSNSVSYTYDADADLATETHHFGGVAGVTAKYYDGADRLVEVVEPIAAEMYRYKYDLTAGSTVSIANQTPFYAHGNLFDTQVYGAASPGLTFAGWVDSKGSAYDALDRETVKYSYVPGSSVTAAPTAQTFAFDTDAAHLGLLGTKTDALGTVTSYSYDAVGNTPAISFSDGTTPNRAYTFDPDRHRTLVSSSVGAVSDTYDLDGRVLTHAQTIAALGQTSLSHTYYGDGTRATLSASGAMLNQANLFKYAYRPDGAKDFQALQLNGVPGVVAWTYTNAGRRASLGSLTYTSEQWSYDAYGRLSQISIPSGAYSNISYDPEGDVLGYSAWGPGGAQFAFDARGQVAGQGFSPFTSRPGTTGPSSGLYGCPPVVSTAGTMACDIRSGAALTGMKSISTGVPGVIQTHTDVFSYDAAGRQVLRSDAWNFSTTCSQIVIKSGTTRTFTCQEIGSFARAKSYDAENHLVAESPQFSGSAAGGLAADFTRNCALPNPIPDQSGATQIVANGGPAAAVQPEYTYGPDGKLFWDSNTGDYLWDGDDLITTTTGNYSVLVDHDAVYTGANSYGYAPITYQLRDPSEALVSVTTGTAAGPWLPGDAFLTNHCGNSEDLYYPQGQPQAAGSYTIMSPFQRSDGIWDGWNNIQGARAYDPSVGQWTAPDAYQGDVQDPASQRPYMYNNNNPYMYEDPSGYCAEDLCIGETIFTVAAVRAITGTFAALAGAVVGAAIAERHNDGKGSGGAPQPAPGAAPSNGNPYSGPVDRPVTAVDSHGNAIPVQQGESINSSPNGDYQQVQGANGKPNGIRMDRGGHSKQPDPKAQQPHGHRRDVSKPGDNPHLPINSGQ